MEEQKRYKVYKDNRENSYICDTSKNVDYKTYQEFVDLLNQQDKHIKELEEENKECKHWENMFHKLSTEEDNAITKVNKSLSNPMTLIDDYNKWADYTIEQIKQSQKQLAIEELEKVKEEMVLNGSDYCEIRQGTSPHNPTDYAWFNYVIFRKFIDNQIKELGGKENE